MDKAYTYIANWKLYFSHAQAIAWCKQNQQELALLAQNNTIILCPSFTELAPVRAQLDYAIHLGAQNCAAQSAGAHTGQVSAQSLKAARCSYCIVGHSECRAQLNETPQDIAQKVVQLCTHDITPIVCVSNEIEQELTPVLETLMTQPEQQSIMIAYEPIEAIGTGKVPEKAQIEHALSKIKQLCLQKISHIPTKLLYGGSVSSLKVDTLKEIALLQGFLIGRASTNFQDFKKIVS